MFFKLESHPAQPQEARRLQRSLSCPGGTPIILSGGGDSPCFVSVVHPRQDNPTHTQHGESLRQDQGIPPSKTGLQGYPPPAPPKWTNWKHYLPVVLRTRVVIMLPSSDNRANKRTVLLELKTIDGLP